LDVPVRREDHGKQVHLHVVTLSILSASFAALLEVNAGTFVATLQRA
jgi:hypothetical protein